MIELTKSSIKCWQKYSYNGKIEVGPKTVPETVSRTPLLTTMQNVHSVLTEPK